MAEQQNDTQEPLPKSSPFSNIWVILGIIATLFAMFQSGRKQFSSTPPAAPTRIETPASSNEGERF
jgi:hypothetical protein